jgi:hypothetical protein
MQSLLKKIAVFPRVYPKMIWQILLGMETLIWTGLLLAEKGLPNCLGKMTWNPQEKEKRVLLLGNHLRREIFLMSSVRFLQILEYQVIFLLYLMKKPSKESCLFPLRKNRLSPPKKRPRPPLLGAA